MRAALAQDLDAPSALAAVDAWAGASTAIDSDDAEAPVLVARACEALLGVALAQPTCQRLSGYSPETLTSRSKVPVTS